MWHLECSFFILHQSRRLWGNVTALRYISFLSISAIVFLTIVVLAKTPAHWTDTVAGAVVALGTVESEDEVTCSLWIVLPGLFPTVYTYIYVYIYIFLKLSIYVYTPLLLKQWWTLSDNYKSLDWIISPICSTQMGGSLLCFKMFHLGRFNVHSDVFWSCKPKYPHKIRLCWKVSPASKEYHVRKYTTYCFRWHSARFCFNLAWSYCFFWQCFFDAYTYCLANVFTYLHALCFPWLLSKQAWPEGVELGRSQANMAPWKRKTSQTHGPSTFKPGPAILCHGDFFLQRPYECCVFDAQLCRGVHFQVIQSFCCVWGWRIWKYTYHVYI